MDGGVRNAHKILAGKPARKRLFGTPRHRSEDSIKVDLTGVGSEVVEGICPAQGRIQW